MVYSNRSELPEQIKKILPNTAQEIYMKTYNSAYEQYRDPKKRKGEETREEVAHKVAWSAVKNSYEKNEQGNWVKKE